MGGILLFNVILQSCYLALDFSKLGIIYRDLAVAQVCSQRGQGC